jgi:hypothetical protein
MRRAAPNFTYAALKNDVQAAEARLAAGDDPNASDTAQIGEVSDGAVDYVGARAFRWRAADEDEDLLVRLVHHLLGSAGLNMRDRTNRNFVPGGRIADVHRQRAAQWDKCLILCPLDVAWPDRAGRVPDEVRARVA